MSNAVGLLPCISLWPCAAALLEQLQVGKHVVGIVALPLANAGSYPLHFPHYFGGGFAGEFHLDHAGLVGRAATFVRADAAVGGLELLRAAAARQRQLLCFSCLEFGLACLSLWHLETKEK